MFVYHPKGAFVQKDGAALTVRKIWTNASTISVRMAAFAGIKLGITFVIALVDFQVSYFSALLHKICWRIQNR